MGRCQTATGSRGVRSDDRKGRIPTLIHILVLRLRRNGRGNINWRHRQDRAGTGDAADSIVNDHGVGARVAGLRIAQRINTAGGTRYIHAIELPLITERRRPRRLRGEGGWRARIHSLALRLGQDDRQRILNGRINPAHRVGGDAPGTLARIIGNAHKPARARRERLGGGYQLPRPHPALLADNTWSRHHRTPDTAPPPNASTT